MLPVIMANPIYERCSYSACLHTCSTCCQNQTSPSSQLACKKKLALRVWLAAVAPLNSGSQYTPKIKILGDPVSPSLGFHDYRNALVALTAALRHWATAIPPLNSDSKSPRYSNCTNRLRLQKYCIFLDCANFLIFFAHSQSVFLTCTDKVRD